MTDPADDAQDYSPQVSNWGGYYLAFFDGRVAEAWFNWLEWVLVTGALYLVAKSTDSALFLVLANFSGILVFVYAVTQVERVSGFIAPKVHAKRHLIRWPLVIILVVGHLAVLITVSKVVNAVLSDSAAQALK